MATKTAARKSNVSTKKNFTKTTTTTRPPARNKGTVRGGKKS